MFTATQLQQTKEQANMLIEEAIENRAKSIIAEFPELTEKLSKTISGLENDPCSDKGIDYAFDCFGSLEAKAKLDVMHSEDKDVIGRYLELISPDSTFQCVDGDWYAVTSLGEPTIINLNDRRCYAVHSRELGLKIDKVEDTDHALAIIEQASRKAGTFDTIVRVDYYGGFMGFVSDAEIAKLSDESLQAVIDSYEVKDKE